ncbi:MAG: hypothetical protein U5K69_11275 [Balneolaceae bacterium]|nr:hypothetical protein [Balneolaceae bacterium]
MNILVLFGTFLTNLQKTSISSGSLDLGSHSSRGNHRRVTILDYQKNKMKMMNQGRQNEQEVEEIRKLVDSLKKRIENLEAIAAGDPDRVFNRGRPRDERDRN